MARIWRDGLLSCRCATTSDRAAGQRNPVTIYRLLTVGTLEEKIYQRQLTKLALSAALMVRGFVPEVGSAPGAHAGDRGRVRG